MAVKIFKRYKYIKNEINENLSQIIINYLPLL